MVFDSADCPVIADLLPSPVYRGQLQAGTVDELKIRLETAKPLAANAFQPAAPIRRWELAVGDPRPLEEWFEPIIGQKISRVDIKDPYCGAGQGQADALMKILKFLTESASGIDRVLVHGKELSFRDPKHQPRHVVQRKLTEELRKIYAGNLLVLILEFQKSRKFHDRTIDIALIDADGCEVEYRYDLTGGIDFLLDPTKETKLYCYRVES